MQAVNVILVFDTPMERLLMCRRRKDPYKGLLNLVGGKVEPGEDGLSAAYRELLEETGIGREAITLYPLMDFQYHCGNLRLEAYAGRLTRDVIPTGDENDLLWCGTTEDFFNTARFAGEGNIGHMVAQVRLHAGELFGACPWSGDENNR